MVSLGKSASLKYWPGTMVSSTGNVVLMIYLMSGSFIGSVLGKTPKDSIPRGSIIYDLLF
jgi:hypothetical protein